MAQCKYCSCWLASGDACYSCRIKAKKDWRYGAKIRYNKYRGLF